MNALADPDPRGDPVPAEQQDAQEGRLEEEREHALGRQRRSEDVAHEARVAAQLVPNWNSITMPVATPTANVTAKMRVQKAALRSHTSLPVRARIASEVAISQARPMVIDGNTKWNAT